VKPVIKLSLRNPLGTYLYGCCGKEVSAEEMLHANNSGREGCQSIMHDYGDVKDPKIMKKIERAIVHQLIIFENPLESMPAS